METKQNTSLIRDLKDSGLNEMQIEEYLQINDLEEKNRY